MALQVGRKAGVLLEIDEATAFPRVHEEPSAPARRARRDVWCGQYWQQATALDVGCVLDDEDVVTAGRHPDPDTGARAPVLKRVEALLQIR